MPRFRFTVRRMIVAVAIVGIVIGTEAMRRRRLSLRSLAEHHAAEIFGIYEENVPDPSGYWEKYWFSDSDRTDPPMPPPIDPSVIKAWEESKERRRLYHEAMMQKYERAARYPWLVVPPDPPEPK